MKLRFTTLLIVGLLSLLTVDLCAQGLSVWIDSAKVQIGATICVPVRAKGFVDVITFQHGIKWDSSVISYFGIQNILLPGIAVTTFPQFNDLLAITWVDPDVQCISKPDGEILYEICFAAKGSEGTFTNITANGWVAEAESCFGYQIWSQAGCIPGQIEILTNSSTFGAEQKSLSTFMLSPNPTLSASTLILESTESGTQHLMVTNVLGHIVLEQNIQVTVGENRFEIPSSALNNKGIYQVILQTAEGVFTRRLSVN